MEQKPIRNKPIKNTYSLQEYFLQFTHPPPVSVYISIVLQPFFSFDQLFQDFYFTFFFTLYFFPFHFQHSIASLLSLSIRCNLENFLGKMDDK